MKLPKDALIQYLSHDELNVRGDESQVFNAVREWLEYEDGRMQYAEEVIRSVRFHAIKVQKLSEIADTDLIDERKECRRLIRNAYNYHGENFMKPLLSSIECKPRGKKGLFILANHGGEGWAHPEANKTYLCSLPDGKSHESNNIGRFLKYSMCMIEVNNFLFLFAADGKTFLPVTLRYDPNNNEWMSLAPAPMGKMATAESAIAHLGDNIYLWG